ncbi:uncharacterized protein LOC132752107 [Ruditapes philippinarum]|uniref:uncharacterized protein LOC132752107 n=1 Tax=Ruditapes philippinarum TaxID=129788 RepID=UPI00295BCEB1|nr:uncharacterized protein LOC132752107 [Ruditapes philippinarum]
MIFQTRVCVLCLLLLNITESKGRSFCGQNVKPETVVKVCTDEDVTNARRIYIDTISVPVLQHISCECVITPSNQSTNFLLLLVNPHGKRSIQFEINDIVLGGTITYDYTNITGATKLLLSTLENYKRKGVCLSISPEGETRFNISCVSRAIGTTIQTSTANITRGSEPTGSEATVKVPIYDIIIPSVICAMLLVIILCLLVYIRRPRRQNQTNQLSDEVPNTLQLSEIDTSADNDKVHRNDGKAAIESFNSYERLKIYENQNCIDEVYEQLDIDKV